MRAILIATLLLCATATLADTPKLIGRVNDHAGVLTTEQRASLERKLESIEQTEGRPQVAVLLPATMNGLDIERYSNDTFRAWKLGQAGKDNGALIVIAPVERKWRIEVGYGLEGVIPDGRAKAIIANDMDPHLKGGKTGFYAALDAATTSIAADIAKEKTVILSTEGASYHGIAIFILAMVVGSILILTFSLRVGRRREEERKEREVRREKMLRDSKVSVKRPEVDAYQTRVKAGSLAAAAMGGAAGGSIAAAGLSTVRRDPPKRREEPRKSYSSSSDSGWSSSSGSGWSSSSSDSGSSSSSFSGGGGDSGGGGASGGD